MTPDEQDRLLGEAMRKILAFAQRAMPESIICVLSFSDSEDGEHTIVKIVVNTEDKTQLCLEVISAMQNLAGAPVFDLTDTQGGMQ